MQIQPSFPGFTVPYPGLINPLMMSKLNLSPEDLEILNSGTGLKYLLQGRTVDVNKALRAARHERELEDAQGEMVKLQNWIVARQKRLIIIYEGRDAAGKGGAIRRFTERLNPRGINVVALPKPTDEEIGQWYFQRYVNLLPNKGEIVFFDRSWYNRAIVEPVNGFCTEKQYQRFMQEVTGFERMLTDDGIILIKFYFSITKSEQLRRLNALKRDPLKRWKLSPLDDKAQELWDEYTRYKNWMFEKTHTQENPWVIIKANDKQAARLASIRYVLGKIPYNQED